MTSGLPVAILHSSWKAVWNEVTGLERQEKAVVGCTGPEHINLGLTPTPLLPVISESYSTSRCLKLGTYKMRITAAVMRKKRISPGTWAITPTPCSLFTGIISLRAGVFACLFLCLLVQSRHSRVIEEISE